MFENVRDAQEPGSARWQEARNFLRLCALCAKRRDPERQRASAMNQRAKPAVLHDVETVF
jgi:hypothetical protein